MSKKTTIPKRMIQAAEQYVKSILKKEGSGHDWYHIDRVRNMALRIAKTENVDSSLVELMALLHELPDRKIVGHGNEKKAYVTITTWLADQGIESPTREAIMYVIKNQSYSVSGLSGQKLNSKEGHVVQDADRLDALG